MIESITKLELEFLHSVQNLATPVWDAIWTTVTYFGEAGIFWIALSLALMIPKKTRRAGFSMGLALLMGVILGNGVLKNVFARPRPYHVDPTLSVQLAWGEMSTDFSFPSGHTLASFEAATALILRHRKWGAAAMVMALLIAVSRICLVVHYPSDVLAGALLGVLFALASSKIVDLLWERFQARQKN